VLEKISERTGETAAAVVWGTHGPTLVRLVQGRHEFASSVPLGHVCAMTFSAAGLIYCAFGEPKSVEPLITRELAQSRATGRIGVPRTKTELNTLVATVKKNALAQVAVESDGGFAAVAAPILDDARRLRFVLTVFGRVGRLNVAPDGPVATFMKDAARKLTSELSGA
jgi:DNA-binding IclR family transcriptional regulator